MGRRKRGEEIDWSAQPLGQVPDTEIARAVECTPSAVRSARLRAGIPAHSEVHGGPGPKNIMWEFEPLGQFTDTEIAESLGCSSSSVRSARKALGIPTHRKHRQRASNDVRGCRVSRPKSIDWDAQPLGELPDLSLAMLLRVKPGWVKAEREARGIAPFGATSASEHQALKHHGRVSTDWSGCPLGTASDSVCAAVAGVSAGTAWAARARLGIPAFCGETDTGIDWQSVPLGQHPDSVIADDLGCKTYVVTRERRARSIPTYDISMRRSNAKEMAAAREARKAAWDAILWEQMTDTEVANRLGCTRAAVGLQRKKRGIPAYTKRTQQPDPAK